MRQFVSLIILFLYFGCYSYSKEYTLMEVNLYPQKNYSIMFLCIKEEDDCIPIYKTDDMYEIIGCFEEKTLPFADYFQLDGFYMTAMQETPTSADKFIKGQDLSYDMVYKSKTVKLISIPTVPGEKAGPTAGAVAGAWQVGYGITKKGASDPAVLEAAKKWMAYFFSYEETVQRLNDGAISAPIIKDFVAPDGMDPCIAEKGKLGAYPS